MYIHIYIETSIVLRFVLLTLQPLQEFFPKKESKKLTCSQK